MVFDSIIFSYGIKRILRGIYLSIPRNSIVGLFGINGSGKSTLLKIGAGFLKQDEGNIFINKKVYTNNLSIDRYNHIGYLSQDSFLPKDLTVKDLANRFESSNVNLKNEPILNKVKNQKIISLSKGELRYLEIILLFSLDRQYYLIDEPFTGIEPLIIEKISKLLLEQKEKGKGILITDHYHRYVTEIIDECYLIRDGYLIKIKNDEEFEKGLLKFGYLVN